MERVLIGRFFVSLFFLFALITSLPLEAQELDALGIAEIYLIQSEGAVAGDIVRFDKNQKIYTLSESVDDSDIIGVIVENPLFVFQTGSEGLPVVKDGQTQVNVTNINGAIEIGDFISPSNVPGKGQKARNSSANVVGTSLVRFPNDELTTTTTIFEGDEIIIGTIAIDLSKKILPAVLDAATKERTENAKSIIQYLVAGFLALGSIYFAFRNFGKSIQNAILSIGRNPLAKTPIQLSVIFNLIIILLISASGVFLSLVILRITLF